MSFSRCKTQPNRGTQNKDWWPNSLNVDILRQHDTKSNPLSDLDYKERVKSLDLEAVKNDIKVVLTDSKDCGQRTMVIMGRFLYA